MKLVLCKRHQERHLGLQGASGDTWNKSTIRSRYISRTRRDHRDTVTVHIHNVSNDDALRILYSVKVSGVPVLATTAAHDMKLVSDAEVVAELGYPVVTKAERNDRCFIYFHYFYLPGFLGLTFKFRLSTLLHLSHR